MAKRGSTKALSVAHEDAVAATYNGKRSPSSGGSNSDQGDVRAPGYLIECKLSGGPGRFCRKHETYDCECKRPTLARQFEKIAVEAYSEGRIPKVALRYYDPSSILSDRSGWVDLIVNLMSDDVNAIDTSWAGHYGSED